MWIVTRDYLSPAHLAPFGALVQRKQQPVVSGLRRLDRLYGCNEIGSVFPDQALTTSVPWPRAGRTRSRPQVGDRTLVARELSRPPLEIEDLHAFDPWSLTANQGGLTRQGVAHYMGLNYQLTGVPFRDQHEVGNQQPVVYRRPSSQGGRENVILSGHHRATAALLQGRHFHARLVEAT